jgi:Ni/Co efflux regulator RcnB
VKTSDEKGTVAMLKKLGMVVLALSASAALAPTSLLAQENYGSRGYYYSQPDRRADRYEAREWREHERRERRAEERRAHETREWRRQYLWNQRYDPYCRTNSYYYGYDFRR